ncbi:MAG: hypothetical protein QXI71_04195 [Candidatus Bathyarchaeia archaeon]|nr:hypothetical protein [Candidatus Bathyarchaeota archaeon]
MRVIKCRYCTCQFFSQSDYEAHLKTHWKQAKNGEGEWMPCELDSYLTERIRNSGALVLGGYRYSLIGDGKILYRTRLESAEY